MDFFVLGVAVLEVSQISLISKQEKNNGQLCTKPQVNRFQWSKVKIGLQLASQTYPIGIKQETFKV